VTLWSGDFPAVVECVLKKTRYLVVLRKNFENPPPRVNSRYYTRGKTTRYHKVMSEKKLWVQVCKMLLELGGVSMDYVKLEVDYEGVLYTGETVSHLQ
jgi:hypothetical protein